MSSVVIAGDTSGSVTLQAPAVAGSTVLTLPAVSGTVSTLGTALTSATAQASTSGTSIDFTGIPSWVKRITVMFSGVSTNGASNLQIQLGDSGGIENTGYSSGAFDIAVFPNSTTGLIITAENIAYATYNGAITIVNLTANTWSSNGTISSTASGYGATSGGSKALSDVLDRIRITTVNGTDTFDAGSINIMYE